MILQRHYVALFISDLVFIISLFCVHIVISIDLQISENFKCFKNLSKFWKKDLNAKLFSCRWKWNSRAPFTRDRSSYKNPFAFAEIAVITSKYENRKIARSALVMGIRKNEQEARRRTGNGWKALGWVTRTGRKDVRKK